MNNSTNDNVEKKNQFYVVDGPRGLSAYILTG